MKNKPSSSQLTGIWVCKTLPAGFTDKAGIIYGDELPRLIIKNDGSFIATNFPERDPYRYTNVIDTWSLSEPGITPTGTWSVYAGGNHFQCRNYGDIVTLRYSISGQYNYYANFERIDTKTTMAEQDGAGQPATAE